MTNREYLEANKIAFDKAMGDFNKTGLKSFDEWLNKEHVEWKFKVGDFLKIKSLGHDIRVVVDIDDKYMYVKILKNDGTFDTWNGTASDSNRKYPDDHTIFICHKGYQDIYEKIF